jgi:hypothetical protein
VSLDREAQAIANMKLYESMPEDVQALSRKHGRVADELYKNGYTAIEIEEFMRGRQ